MRDANHPFLPFHDALQSRAYLPGGLVKGTDGPGHAIPAGGIPSLLPVETL
ncbi:MAG: hypothetical protein ACP5NU_04160 [Methanomicrobiales archaeon]